MYKDVICDLNNIKEEGWRCIGLEYLYGTEIKLVLFNLDSYKLRC